MSTFTKSISLGFYGSSESFTAQQSGTSTQVGDGALLAFQHVDTSAEALALGDLANVSGGLLIKNNDATNYVEIDSANTFDKFPQKILAGQAIFLASQTLTIYAKANTAAVDITVAACEL